MTLINRIMELADDYAALRSNWDSSNTNQLTPHLVLTARKELEAELSKMLTPLTHDQAKLLAYTYGRDPLNLIFQTELLHGIGDEQ